MNFIHSLAIAHVQSVYVVSFHLPDGIGTFQMGESLALMPSDASESVWVSNKIL